jgi:hypothetical protein
MSSVKQVENQSDTVPHTKKLLMQHLELKEVQTLRHISNSSHSGINTMQINTKDSQGVTVQDHQSINN